jgi:hypothetical protein
MVTIYVKAELSPPVDGHQDLPSDGHEVQATAIAESDRIR